MHKKFLFILTALAIFFSSSAEAAKIDVYREAILNKSYTIKYEISQVPIYRNNKDAAFSDKGLKEIAFGGFGKKHIQKGIVVSDGKDNYTETAIDSTLMKIAYKDKISTHEIPAIGVCRLIKDNEIFNFYYETKNDKKNYYGGQSLFGKSHSVKAADEKQYQQWAYYNLMNEYSFGNNNVLSNIFSPIIPPERLIATPYSPIYQFVNSGTARDGLFYEDFASNKDNIFSAIRYYFNGNDLVKVAHVSYLKNGSQLQAYEKFVVDITEFSTTPDKKYLSLPAELKVKKK